MSKLIKILSIDGGGIRGLIPATIIAEIEKRTQKPVSELFDLVAGTSSGGVSALALTMLDENGKPAYSAKDVVDFFDYKGLDSYTKFLYRLSFLAEILQKYGFRQQKYPQLPFLKILEMKYKSKTIKESLTDVLIPAYNVKGRNIVMFTRKKARENNNYNFPLYKIAYAGCALTTYLDPLKLEIPDSSDFYVLIDGGIFASNPAICAFLEAKKLFPESTDFLMVSLGTGEPTTKHTYKSIKRWTGSRWARRVQEMASHGNYNTIEQLFYYVLPDKNGEKRYYRFQAKLHTESESTDNVNPENLKRLSQLAESIIYEKSDIIDGLCHILTR